ncbi:MAG: class II aldolase/adducin family protein [Candidatus Velthaea sp.]
MIADASAKLREALDDLVIANHILAEQGVVDSFGHVSMRHPERPDRYLLARSRAPELVEADDIIEYTLEGEAIDAGGRAPYAERPIHGRIYAARPDVDAVCHNHATATIPFGVTGVPLRPIFHMASVIGSHVPVWDIAARFGDTNLLVTTNDMGDDLAAALGPNRVALMRGHGSAVAGKTLRDAVFTSVYLQVNANLLATALALGDVRYLSDGEVAAASTMLSQPLAQNRAWESWASRAR